MIAGVGILQFLVAFLNFYVAHTIMIKGGTLHTLMGIVLIMTAIVSTVIGMKVFKVI